jgi:CRP-like cAMP-binding protein
MNQVRPNTLLSMLSRVEDSFLFDNLQEFSADRHTVLQRAGEITEHVYFPLSGMVSFLTVMNDGTAVETASVGYDNAAGCNTALSGRNANCQLIVQLDMKALRIRSQLFRAAYEKGAGIRHIVQVSSELLIEQVQQTAACHALHAAEQRLGRWLLQCYDYAGNEFLDLTQDFVSEMLGVRRTTVSQVAATLQSEGLIRYRRGHVTVLDRERLLARSCECYDTVMKHRNGHPALKPIAVPPQ